MFQSGPHFRTRQGFRSAGLRDARRSRPARAASRRRSQGSALATFLELLVSAALFVLVLSNLAGVSLR